MCFTSATTSFGSHTGLISLVAVALLGACSGQGHPCIEYERTIEHGIYGEAVYKEFQKSDTPLYNVKFTLTAFGNPAFYEARSNEDGLYELELPTGTAGYSICADLAMVGCTNVTVSSLLRMDLVVSEGQVFWDAANFGECSY
jgi:hypothetical protein